MKNIFVLVLTVAVLAFVSADIAWSDGRPVQDQKLFGREDVTAGYLSRVEEYVRIMYLKCVVQGDTHCLLQNDDLHIGYGEPIVDAGKLTGTTWFTNSIWHTVTFGDQKSIRLKSILSVDGKKHEEVVYSVGATGSRLIEATLSPGIVANHCGGGMSPGWEEICSLAQ